MLVTSPEVDAINGAVTAAMHVRAVELTDSAVIGDLEVLFEKRAQIDALIADRIGVATSTGGRPPARCGAAGTSTSGRRRKACGGPATSPKTTRW